MTKKCLILLCLALSISCAKKKEDEDDKSSKLSSKHMGAIISASSQGISAGAEEAEKKIKQMILARTFSPQTTVNIDSESDCPEGGSISTTGSETVDSTDLGDGNTDMDLDMEIDAKYEDCKVPSSNGKTYKINGEMNIAPATAHFESRVDGDTSTLSGNFSATISGKFDVEGSDLDANNCKFDLELSITINADGTTSGSWDGTMCGKDVSGEAEVTEEK